MRRKLWPFFTFSYLLVVRIPPDYLGYRILDSFRVITDIGLHGYLGKRFIRKITSLGSMTEQELEMLLKVRDSFIFEEL